MFLCMHAGAGPLFINCQAVGMLRIESGNYPPPGLTLPIQAVRELLTTRPE